MARLGKRQRDRKRHQRAAVVEGDAAMLPASGPIADLVVRIGRELDLCVAAGRASWESVPYLRPLGLQAFELLGSIRGMQAVCQKASEFDPRRGEVRRDMLDKAWDGIGDARGCWMA